MSTKPKLELVESFLDAISENAEERADALLADDAEIISRGTTITAQDYVNSLSAIPTEINNYDLLETVESGNQILVWAEITGQLSGQLYGVDPSEEEITLQIVALFEIEDEKIQRYRHLDDQSTVFEQLGLLDTDPHTERVRDQYYSVLNRVLRHNLRNRLSIAQAEAESLITHPESEPAETGARIQEVIDEILTTAEKARNLQQRAIDTDLEPEAITLDSVVGPLVEEYDAKPEVACDFVHPDDRPPEITTGPQLLDIVLDELLDNAVEHAASESVEVTVDAHPSPAERYALELTVTDDGPGIPESELAPIRNGAETELLHGSGMGLWIVEWATTRLHGEVAFEPSPPDGTTVRIQLPELTASGSD